MNDLKTTHPGPPNDEGERLERARTEFRTAWDTRVAQRAARLDRARRGVSISRFATNMLQTCLVLCGGACWLVWKKLGALPVNFLVLLLALLGAALLLLLGLIATIYFEHRVVSLEESELEHL